MYTEAGLLSIEQGNPSWCGFSPDGQKLAVATSLGYVQLYNYPGLDLIKSEIIHSKGINEAAWSKDGNYIVACSDDKTASIIDANQLIRLRKFTGHRAAVLSIDISSDNTKIVTGSKDVSFRVWDPRDSSPIQEVGGHTEPVASVSFNFDDSLILTAGYDGIVRIWDTFSYICLRTFTVKGYPISRAFFTPNSEFFAVFSIDNTVKLIKITGGTIARSFYKIKNEEYRVDGGFLKFGPAGEMFSSSEDGSIIGWDIDNPEPKWIIETGFPQIYCAAASNDGIIMCAAGKHEIKLYKRTDTN